MMWKITINTCIKRKISITNECYQNDNYQQINAESGLTCMERKLKWGTSIIKNKHYQMTIVTKWQLPTEITEGQKLPINDENHRRNEKCQLPNEECQLSTKRKLIKIVCGKLIR